ncbi:MAG TPA: HEAT repeat domain-containing protein, partial [Gemmataceae bacterium]|nr:HEAT repeat domain-containing protein [Gemmataceae bacterium]
GLKIDWAKLPAARLAGLLDDPRPAVRRRAIEALGGMGAGAVPALTAVIQSGKTAEARRNAVWAATRIDGAAARAAVRRALAAADDTVRQAAIHSVSVRRDREAVPALLKLLKQPSPHNRRAAAEALGRIGDRSAVPALLEALGRPDDRVLEHSLTYALIEIGDRDGTAAGLRSDNPRIRRAALIALDQMDGGGLAAATVAKELTSPDPRMKEAAAWVVGRHPNWGGELAGYLKGRLSAKDLTPAEREGLTGQLARFAATAAVQQLLAERLADPQAPREVRRVVLRAMARAALKETPTAWLDGMTKVLAGGDVELVREAVATARAFRAPKGQTESLIAGLYSVARDDKAPVEVRLGALAAMPGGPPQLSAAHFALLTGHLDPEKPVVLRALAADVLSRARLSNEQLLALTEVLKAVGPMELDRLLEPFARSTDEAVGRKLAAALKESSSRSALRVDAVKARLAKYGPAVQKQAEELYALLDADLAKQRVRLEQLMGSLKSGDVRRGQAVFNSAKAACSSCHAIGYLGGNFGPDLTHIGRIRTERDLLEAIVFPSASFVRSYEPVTVATKSGKTYNGVLRRDAAEEVVLATSDAKEVRIPREEIEAMEPSKVSIMPAGLDQILTPQDLADLVAFLRACK